MENKIPEYIERITIKGLWGRYDVDWTLNPDVNILVGENGTGKTTILNAVKHLFDSLENLSNGNKPQLNKVIDTETIQFSKCGFTLKNTEEGVEIEYFENDKVGQLYAFNNYVTPVYSAYIKSILEKFSYYYVNTFEVVNSNLLNEGSQLDGILNDLEKEYISYRFKKLRAYKKDPKSLEKETYFIETINRLFRPTQKEINPEDEKLRFIVDKTTVLHWKQLSSGEKQLLILLLTVLCQDETPSVLLLDEPEISLHLRWQYELVQIIRTLNPKCQVIIATHSPSIYGKGWRDKVTFIDEIIPQLKAELTA